MSEPSLSQISPVRRLPPELVIIILAHLNGPGAKRDLLSCSFVSRDWCSASRIFLFEELSFTVNEPADVSGDLHLVSTRSGNLRDLLTFLNLSPHLCPYVHTLHLHAPVGSHQQLEDDQYPNVDPTTLARILRKLPLLDSLDLYDILFLPEHYFTWKQDEFDYPGNLQQLSIRFGSRAGEIDSFDDALHLLEIFSGEIRELCLSTIYAVRLRIPNTQSLRRLRIGSLVIDEVTDIGPLVHAVSMSPSIWSKTLTSIYLSWINMKDLRSAEGLLDSIKDSLINFGCNLFPLLDSKPADEELFQILNFSEMHSLKSVTLGLVLLPDASWNTNTWKDICRILSSLPDSRASQLQVNLELAIDRLPYSTHIALPSSWLCLDKTLRGKCKNLKLSPARKTFHIPAEESFNTAMQDYISERLPELAKARIVQF